VRGYYLEVCLVNECSGIACVVESAALYAAVVPLVAALDILIVGSKSAQLNAVKVGLAICDARNGADVIAGNFCAVIGGVALTGHFKRAGVIVTDKSRNSHVSAVGSKVGAEVVVADTVLENVEARIGNDIALCAAFFLECYLIVGHKALDLLVDVFQCVSVGSLEELAVCLLGNAVKVLGVDVFSEADSKYCDICSLCSVDGSLVLCGICHGGHTVGQEDYVVSVSA